MRYAKKTICGLALSLFVLGSVGTLGCLAIGIDFNKNDKLEGLQQIGERRRRVYRYIETLLAESRAVIDDFGNLIRLVEATEITSPEYSLILARVNRARAHVFAVGNEVDRAIELTADL